MAETNLAFSKIVATPTPTAWSQAYSAGRLFAALSLQQEEAEQSQEESLSIIGKDLISTLESEFFTLENKDLESIKNALTATIGRVKEGVKISLVVCFLNDNVLYLFAAGGGKAVLKRGEKIGTVLQAEEDHNIKSASGYVQEEDLIILQTKSFLRLIPPSTLALSLDQGSPEEIAENLAPQVHERAEGGASAVILLYKKSEGVADELSPQAVSAQEARGQDSQGAETIGQNLGEGIIPVEEIDDSLTPDAVPIETPGGQNTLKMEGSIGGAEPVLKTDEVKTIGEEPTDEVEEAKQEEIAQTSQTVASETSSPFLTDRLSRRQRGGFKLPVSFKLPSGLSRQRKIILTIAGILLALILVTSVLALRGGSDSPAFDTVFAQAQEKYDEGLSLKDLNGPLAQESFREAKSILEQNLANFDADSDEGRQISELLAKINGELGGGANGQTVNTKEVEKGESQLLSVAIDNSGASYFTQNDDFIYFVDGSGIQRIDKGNSEKEEIIEKSWDQAGGIGLFGSNVYVLDKENGILKFTPSGEEFSEGNYFPGDAPDLGSSVAMAIDGSIYVLSRSGIDKYTRGAKDDFSISGLDKGFSSPTKIFASEDADNIYVLDNGNSRVVVFDKSGKFTKAYSANVIKGAKDFDVQEAENRILVLSGGKIYQIDTN